MKFSETKLKGAFIIEPDLIEDERGFFARVFCRKEMESHGLNSDIVQCNISFNKTKGTLRGMHYQIEPHAEAKLVRCTAGAIYDVIVDLRRESSTFQQWLAVELSADSHKTLYIPEGCAHGFQTLTDNAEIFYQHAAEHSPDHACGILFDDPSLKIVWPLPVSIISAKDQSYPPIDQRFRGIDL